MTSHKSINVAPIVSRRKLLQASAAALGAAALPMPAIAQAKPFAGVTLHGASFQHRFFTLLQNYIPEFEQQTGMKVDLQLSAFPVYNQQANLELSSGGSAYDFLNVTFFLAARWVAAGLLANLDELTSIQISRRRTGIRRTSSTAHRYLTATPRARPTAIPGKAAPW
jgi:multiple sugar transport system substrate-binding protein